MFAKIEQVLVDRGHTSTAVKVQHIARMFESSYNKAKQKRWVAKAIENEFKTIEMIQGEMADNRICLRLQGDTGSSERSEEFLEICERLWWLHTKHRHEHLFNKPKGSYIRNFDLHKNGYLLYTPEEVQAACRAMGGCCAYDCGCCYKERSTHRMKHVLAHCTFKCSCCVRRSNMASSVVDERAKRIVVYDYLSKLSALPDYDSLYPIS